jgi:HK97 family phage major capsid protein
MLSKQSAERMSLERMSRAARAARVTGVRNFTGEDAELRAYRFGMWALAGPVARYLGDAPAGVVKRAQEFCIAQGIPLERAHSKKDNTSGGVLVPVEFSADILDLRERYGVFRRNAYVIGMMSDRKQVLRRAGEMEAYPVGDGQTIPESQMNWDAIGLNAHKIATLAKFESEVSEDSITSFGDELAGEIARAMAKFEDRAGFTGDGTEAFHGITGVVTKLRELDVTVANIAGLAEASGNLWSEITLEDMRKVISLVPDSADEQNTKWYCSRKFFAEVMLRLSGETILQRKIFLGYPVEVTQVMPRKEANSQIACLFGDLHQAATFGDRRKPTFAITDSNRDDFATDLLTIRGTERIDIVVHGVGNASAEEEEREAGPIVGLIMQAS